MRKFFPIATILFLLFFSMMPTFYELYRSSSIHDDRYFELVHNFYTDYNFYLSRIRQGKEGKWLATEKYTSEPHAPGLSQVLYVFIGRVSDWSHIQTPYVWISYHAMRVFFGFLYLYILWKVSQWVFSEKGQETISYLTFLLAATASTWPKFELVEGWPRFGGFMPWWSVVDSNQRMTFMPHVLFGQGLLLFILWVFASSFAQYESGATADKSGFISKKLSGNYLFLGVVGIVLGIIFPPALVFIYTILGFVSIGEVSVVIWAGKMKMRELYSNIKLWFVESVYGRMLFFILSVPTLLYFSLLFTRYPWKRLVEFDVLHPTKFSFPEYFMAVGPVLPLGFLGILIWICTKGWSTAKKMGIFVVWIFSWLLFLFVFDKIPEQSPTRFTEMIPHVPLALVGMWGLVQLSYQSSAISRQTKKILSLLCIGYWKLVIPTVIILFAFGSMGSSYLWLRDFVDHKLRATYPIVPHGAEVMYPMKVLIDGLTWLQVYTPRDAVVFSGITTGNYIPVYAGNTAYLGHANTVKAEEKEAAMYNFYQNHLGREAEMNFLKSEGISYVFYGPEEREIAHYTPELTTYYPELIEVYRSEQVRIYKVQY
ncbi:hypothetical protein HY947_01835 [Candidatus Gottesmanbacteria bacterium]|nr:hypothetical protein [Candidatus Gottesmanbacteria bacterium]